jgi:hypothetical protein
MNSIPQTLDELLAAIDEDKLAREQSDEWKVNNLEYDLTSTDWIVAKAQANEYYAQNIYAALCNMQWQKLDVVPILKDEYWHCSWRYAGGLVADLVARGGDYMDYYCSGIGDGDCFVAEGEVTDEIREDFLKLGWQPVPYTDHAY